MEAVFVDIVSKVVTPRATLAGTAQKEIVITQFVNALCTMYFFLEYLGVNPEGEPRYDDKHTSGDVDGKHVVGKLPLQGQLHQQAAVFS